MQIFVKTFTGRTIVIEVESTTTYGKIKQQILAKDHSFEDTQNIRLIFGGKLLQLGGDSDPIDQDQLTEIGREGVIHAVKRLELRDLSNLGDKDEYEFRWVVFFPSNTEGNPVFFTEQKLLPSPDSLEETIACYKCRLDQPEIAMNTSGVTNAPYLGLVAIKKNDIQACAPNHTEGPKFNNAKALVKEDASAIPFIPLIAAKKVTSSAPAGGKSSATDWEVFVNVNPRVKNGNLDFTSELKAFYKSEDAGFTTGKAARDSLADIIGLDIPDNLTATQIDTLQKSFDALYKAASSKLQYDNNAFIEHLNAWYQSFGEDLDTECNNLIGSIGLLRASVMALNEAAKQLPENERSDDAKIQNMRRNLLNTVKITIGSIIAANNKTTAPPAAASSAAASSSASPLVSAQAIWPKPEYATLENVSKIQISDASKKNFADLPSGLRSAISLATKGVRLQINGNPAASECWNKLSPNQRTSFLQKNLNDEQLKNILMPFFSTNSRASALPTAAASVSATKASSAANTSASASPAATTAASSTANTNSLSADNMTLTVKFSDRTTQNEQCKGIILFDNGGVLGGIPMDPNDVGKDDLILGKTSAFDENIANAVQVIPKGKLVLQKLKILHNQGFLFCFHSANTEKDQLDLLMQINAAAVNADVPTLEIFAIANQVSPRQVMAVKRNSEGIIVCDFDPSISTGKASLRRALEAGLGIKEQDRRKCTVLDDGSPVITAATTEGYAVEKVNEISGAVGEVAEEDGVRVRTDQNLNNCVDRVLQKALKNSAGVRLPHNTMPSHRDLGVAQERSVAVQIPTGPATSDRINISISLADTPATIKQKICAVRGCSPENTEIFLDGQLYGTGDEANKPISDGFYKMLCDRYVTFKISEPKATSTVVKPQADAAANKTQQNLQQQDQQQPNQQNAVPSAQQQQQAVPTSSNASVTSASSSSTLVADGTRSTPHMEFISLDDIKTRFGDNVKLSDTDLSDKSLVRHNPPVALGASDTITRIDLESTGPNSHKKIDNCVAYCVQGRAAEDRTVLCQLPQAAVNLGTNAEKLIPQIFEQVFLELQERVKNLQTNAGSCACVVANVPDGNGGAFVFAFNLGDSAAFLLTDDDCQRLTLDHGYDNAQERARVENVLKENLRKNGSIKTEKLDQVVRITLCQYKALVDNTGRTLQVFRALGNADFEGCGLSHIPQYSLLHLEAGAMNKHPRVMIASDGIVDEKHPPQLILQASSTCKEDNTAFAKAIMNSKTGTDDASVVVIDCNQPVVGGVFDGHGNPFKNPISNMIEQQFKAVLEDAVTKVVANIATNVAANTESSLSSVSLPTANTTANKVVASPQVLQKQQADSSADQVPNPTMPSSATAITSPNDNNPKLTAGLTSTSVLGNIAQTQQLAVSPEAAQSDTNVEMGQSQEHAAHSAQQPSGWFGWIPTLWSSFTGLFRRSQLSLPTDNQFGPNNGQPIHHNAAESATISWKEWFWSFFSTSPQPQPDSHEHVEANSANKLQQ